MRILFLITAFAVTSFFASSVLAQEEPNENPPAQAGSTENISVSKADFQAARMKNTMVVRVAYVIDGRTILTKSGKVLSLTGLDFPPPYGNAQSEAEWDIAARNDLAKVLKDGTEIKVWQTLGDKYGRTNRMGQLLCHIEIKKNGEWVNGRLVTKGLARALPAPYNPEITPALYAQESKARAAKAGLWANPESFGVLPSADAAKANGQIAIVEGAIEKVGSSQNYVYLNFGKDSKKDFTVRVSPLIRKVMARNGIDPMALAGEYVRVRGWVRDWNGPFMDLESLERIEISPKDPIPPTSEKPEKSAPKESEKDEES